MSFLGMCTALNVCVLLDPQECTVAFQRPFWTSHSPDLPFKFFGQSFVFPNRYHGLGSCDVKQLPLKMFGKCPVNRAFPTISRPAESCQITTSHGKEAFSGS